METGSVYRMLREHDVYSGLGQQQLKIEQSRDPENSGDNGKEADEDEEQQSKEEIEEAKESKELHSSDKAGAVADEAETTDDKLLGSTGENTLSQQQQQQREAAVVQALAAADHLAECLQGVKVFASHT